MRKGHDINKTLLLPALVLLVGCAHFEDRPIDPQANLSAFGARSLSDPGLLAFMHKTRPDTDVSKGWNAADLTLAAFYYQPKLVVSRLQWETAQSAINQAAERPNPTLGIAPAFNNSTPSGAGISPWVVGASLDIPLDYSGKRKAHIAETRALARAAWLQLVHTAWQTRSNVRTELLTIHAARQRSLLQQQQVDVLKAHLKQLEKQHRLGVTSLMQMNKARQDQAAAEKDRIEAQKQEALSTARLAATIGIPVQALHGVSFNFSGFDAALPESPPSSGVQQQALMNRADILGMLAEYEAAQSRLQFEIAKQYPELSIGPGYEFDQGDHKWGLGVSLTLPVFNHNRAGIETARLKRKEVEAQFNALQAEVIGVLDAALADYTHSLRQFRAAQKIEHESEERLHMLEQSAFLGAISRSKLFLDQISLNEAKQDALAARTEVLAAWGRLEYELESPADLPEWKTALEQSINRSEDLHETR